MGRAEAETDVSSMRAPRDVIRMIGVLASLDGRTIGEFCDTDLREWVSKKYRARLAKEGRDLGEGG